MIYSAYCDKSTRKENSYHTHLSQSSVMYIHRNYEQFKKWFNWFEKSPATLPAISRDIAIIEYMGNFPCRCYHGSVQYEDRNSKYLRTKPQI